MEGSNMASLWPFRSEQKPLLPIGFNSGQWGSGRIKSRLPTRTIRDPHPLAPTLKQGLIFLFYYYSQKNAFRIQRSYKAEDPRKYASLNNVSDCFISLDNVTEAQARGWWWVGGGGFESVADTMGKRSYSLPSWGKESDRVGILYWLMKKSYSSSHILRFLPKKEKKREKSDLGPDTDQHHIHVPCKQKLYPLFFLFFFIFFEKFTSLLFSFKGDLDCSIFSSSVIRPLPFPFPASFFTKK